MIFIQIESKFKIDRLLEVLRRLIFILGPSGHNWEARDSMLGIIEKHF